MASVKANNAAVGEGLAPPVYHTLARQQPLGEAYYGCRALAAQILRCAAPRVILERSEESRLSARSRMTSGRGQTATPFGSRE